jgi:DNA-binding response OmpR family regulator
VLSSSPTAEISTPTILVVDDERLIRWSLRQGLSREGFRVEEAADGATTLGLLAGPPGRFAVVILDYRLPDRQDLSLLREIRRMAPGVPVLMMTAFAEPIMRKEALALGALDVIDKPFQISSVISRVRSALTRSA